MVCKLQINNNCTKDIKDEEIANLKNRVVSNKDTLKKYDDNFVSIDDLRDPDINILKVLLDNKDENSISTFSFSGLKIKLNLHQEILSRSLRRLKELKLIKKTESGYILTPSSKLLFPKLGNTSQMKKRKTTQIIQIHIPFKISDQLVKDLIGKWHGNLRWIGIIQNIIGYKLKWKDIENFIEITMNISDNDIVIEINDDSPSNIIKAFKHSTKILDWVSSMAMENNLLMYSIDNTNFNSIYN